MDWKLDEGTGCWETGGRVGFWEVRRVGNGQASVSLALRGTPSYLATRIGIFGSPAEARLAVAAYDGRSPVRPVGEQIAAAGFVERGTAEGGRRYVGPSPTGSLVLVIREAAGKAAGLTLDHHPRVGVRWSTLAAVSTPAMPPGAPGMAEHLAAALALAEARLRIRASHARPLAEGDEVPFAQALVADEAVSVTVGPR